MLRDDDLAKPGKARLAPAKRDRPRRRGDRLKRRVDLDESPKPGPDIRLGFDHRRPNCPISRNRVVNNSAL